MEIIRKEISIATSWKTQLWGGRIISFLCILFLLYDAMGKILKETSTIATFAILGMPEHTIRDTGIVLLICTIIYAIPRTARLGAVLLTAYLGGAMAIMFRVEQPVYFALVFGILVWVGLALRDEKVCKFLFSN